MTFLPDDPLKQGEAEDLQPDHAAIAAEEAQKAADEAHDAEAAAVQSQLEKAIKPTKDEPLVSAEELTKDLDFLNTK